MRRTITIVGSAVVIVAAIVLFFFIKPANKVTLTPPVTGLGDSIMLTISDWQGPLYFENGKPKGADARYEWVPAFEAVNASPALPYGEFLKFVSSDYVQQFKFTEATYNQIAQAAAADNSISKVAVYYTVQVECQSGDYIFVARSSGAGEPPEIPKDVYLSLEKKIDGNWKIVPPDPQTPVLTVPWNNLGSLRDIISSRKAHLAKSGKLQAEAPNH